jgi:hypothetical protein
VKKVALVSLIGLLSACVELEPEWREPFVGRWTINVAHQDGVHQPAWLGTRLEITQLDETGGNYTLSHSTDVSIWPESGTWLVADEPYLFIRGDILDVLYSLDVDHLRLSFLIPRNVPCVEGEPCLGMVYGQWYFEAIRQ